jgi:hypothetical protein
VWALYKKIHLQFSLRLLSGDQVLLNREP